MTILLHDYCDLEERPSKHLKAWKAWHLIFYAAAGIFGIVNYVFLQNAMAMVGDNCVLFPRELAFRVLADNSSIVTTLAPTTAQLDNETVAQTAVPDNVTKSTNDEVTENDIATDTEEPRMVLDTVSSLFGRTSDCQFAEYMPLMSMMCAVTWATFFTMCPGGGHSRSGLQKPWRILPPAFLFALVMVGLTGHSFTRTNEGLGTFCAAFHNITNTTSCSSVDAHLASSANVSWSFSGRVAGTRAASAAVWGSWACAAALFLARCLAAPDFRVRRTSAYLKDPNQIITPYLKKSKRRVPSAGSSMRHDNYSIKSEPTVTTELVVASIEQDSITAPPSLEVSPFKKRPVEDIEMASKPNGLKQH
ncbi:uncharacterized protein LOC121725982 [Aricia agestis]|uniref:uncharacterized protein LOC121725982 n=1 Tax=Aricia agestis TaxID=91739 RepID=UPI001C206D2C|nr:uncharacterized protein LOC121725982 [Aricia agestis]XP_041969133.1 uncharacterized protein LOC121725982 [Aricia agestis]